jgi:hypothetical protein
MKTRVGKIARLPAHIRDELNHRLAQGAIGRNLLTWLNAQPEVQQVMAEEFGGTKITHQNLSVWRLGGYAEWSGTRSDRAQWQDLLDHLEELNHQQTNPASVPVTKHLATLVVFELGQALDKLHRMEDSPERWRIFRLLCRGLSNLRMDDCREKRIRLWDAKAAGCAAQFNAIPTNSNHKKIIY